ncbi:MAG: delta-aminolevulinic acid dehydratase [Microbacterium sp. SCN 70-200]|uniref:porphobilinogen synthase n=1 Tax=unclassified Microbacterium TaxID=2609290 RepID=UPI000868E6CE|nr:MULTISPECIES: porphobilinogen synthase [unclassified Microbacterium]MBN9213414.1 porphobilinogen synthase [Microbacterium sp.]ODT40481.1 MAG: delta-aminolevulinic acid dehydratase [Microbacterium sp. SCN 70-200]OJV85051.1 MAG: delta-aminolevulinic acid dehydratase [Microbacterium sp. 70-16]
MTAFPDRRLRRLRQTPALRRLVAETELSPSRLVLPVFVKEGIDAPLPIASMPGVSQHPLSGLAAVVEEAVAAGIGGIMLFGVPSARDATGTGAVDPEGILNRAIRVVADAAAGRITLQADLCLDEFTDHGHCGVLAADGAVDNDATLEIYAQMALAQAEAGADILGLSGMMDGQVAACRAALDAAGRTDVVILAYSAKYASAFYGPFRDAVESTLTGDRRTYQLDAANGREGVQEALIDIDEGADIVMVKPAGPYLDVLARVADVSSVPVWAYQVSGEYAMIEHAAAAGVIDRERAIGESLIGIRRAGAEAILTYWAIEVAGWLRAGRSLA